MRIRALEPLHFDTRQAGVRAALTTLAEALVLAADGCGRRVRLVNAFSAQYHLPRAFEDLSQDLPAVM